MFKGARFIWAVPRQGVRTFARYESSSSAPSSSSSSSVAAKKKLAMLEQQKQQQQQESVMETVMPVQVADAQRPKKGFSSVKQVPSTVSIKPKELLLDNLFQGYRPLTLPVSPPQANKKSPTVVYFEFDENLDLDGLSDFTNRIAEDPEDVLRDRNLTRYQISSYSFSKPNEVAKEPVAKAGSKKTDFKMNKRRAGRRRMTYGKTGKGRR